MAKLDAIIYGIIEQRRKSGAAETNDLLSMLLHARDEDGSRMSDVQLRDEFLPERWEGDLAKTLHRYAYFPFGGGPRLCIGQAFAQMKAVLLLATLARAFEVEVLPRPRPTPEPSVTLRPKRGLRVRLARR